MSEKRSLQDVFREAREEIDSWPEGKRRFFQFAREEMRRVDGATAACDPSPALTSRDTKTG